jgi:hypothetical protein
MAYICILLIALIVMIIISMNLEEELVSHRWIRNKNGANVQ